MTDPHHRGAEIALEVPDQFDDLRLRGDIQRGGGFVGDQQFGIAGQGDGDHHPLALSAGELMRIAAQPVRRVGKTDGLQQLQCPRAGLPTRLILVCLQRFGDLAFDCQQRIQRRSGVLENESDPSAVHPAQRAGRCPHEFLVAGENAGATHLRAGGVEQAGRGEHRHRLAGTGLTDDAEGLLRFDTDRHIAHDPPPSDAHSQVADGQHRRAHRRLRASIMVRCLGSSTSRRLSPSRLQASTMTKMASPGNTAIHHASVTKP